MLYTSSVAANRDNATAITEVIVDFSSVMETRTTGKNNRLLVDNCCIYLHIIIRCKVTSQRPIRGHEMSCCIWIRGEIHRQCVNQYFIYSVTWFNFAQFYIFFGKMIIGFSPWYSLYKAKSSRPEVSDFLMPRRSISFYSRFLGLRRNSNKKVDQEHK